MATGYSTLYGDSAGGFAVIKDVPKTLVYELCRHRNARAEAEGRPGPIPAAVLDKPPSAELRPDQRDDQSLPPYELLDPVLGRLRRAGPHGGRPGGRGLRPGGGGAGGRAWSTGPSTSAARCPPGCASRAKAFGKDRRMPITNHYRATRRRAASVPAGAGRRLRRRRRRGDRPDGPAAVRGGRAHRRLPLGRAAAVRADRRAGPPDGPVAGPGPPRRGEPGARLARRAVGRPPAGARRASTPRRSPARPRRRPRPLLDALDVPTPAEAGADGGWPARAAAAGRPAPGGPARLVAAPWHLRPVPVTDGPTARALRLVVADEAAAAAGERPWTAWWRRPRRRAPAAGRRPGARGRWRGGRTGGRLVPGPRVPGRLGARPVRPRGPRA